MKKFLLALVALVLLPTIWASPAAAAAPKHRYAGFYYNGNNAEIADAIAVSYAKDPTGNTRISTEKCRTDRSCATPNNYLTSFRAHDPFRTFSLGMLADFIRSLKRVCGITGKLQTDSIDMTTGLTVVNGAPRFLLKDECVWVDPENGVPVLAEHCANPVGVEINLDCVYIDFETQDVREFSVIWARYKRPKDRCFAYRKVQKTFEPDSVSALWLPVKPGCLGRPCSLADDNNFFGEDDKAHGQIPLSSPGHWQIRLSPDELLLLCLKLRNADGTVESSFGNRTRWKMDYRFVNGAWHARVYYQTDDVLKDGRTMNGPDGLAFYASNAKAEAEMHGLIVKR